jgi:hypothetical protein
MTSNGNSCLTPKQQDDKCGDMRWLSIHKRFLQECIDKDPESKFNLFSTHWIILIDLNLIYTVLFIGDDILEGLSFTEIYR